MSAPQSLHRQLLDQARTLAKKEPKRPKQASIRRAISAGYYSLFHFLISEATARIVGTAYSKRLMRKALSRSFAHRGMVEVAKKFSGPGAALPPHLHPIVSGEGNVPFIPEEIAAMGTAFTDLQEARHQADYKPERDLQPRRGNCIR